MTEVFRVNRTKPERGKIRAAAEVIRMGGLVAFPTETVYGLGANALDEKAVLRIFKAKKRPPDNPLIVHIARTGDVSILASFIPKRAEKLMKKFWPGPLTILMPKSEMVPDVTTAGLATVAVRMPSHPVARAFILEADVPIAAPSANMAGRPSPTAAKHVLDDLSGRIDAVIDGGKVGLGVESTVLDLSGKVPIVLRPGPVTIEDLEKILPDVEIHAVAKTGASTEAAVALAPGMKYRHYAPAAEVILVEGPEEKIPERIMELAEKITYRGKKVGILATKETFGSYGAGIGEVVGSRKNPKT
ncbi:MAG: L-threonylcarbamoyladenylate synthase, partial [Candidatus Hadarchaeota archaeon]